MAGKQGLRGFGHVRKLPSKRFQTSYVGPDGVRHLAVVDTFITKLDAEGWFAVESWLVASGDWSSPAARRTAAAAAWVSLSEYATMWLRQRTLKLRIVALYRELLAQCILPALGRQQIGDLTPAVVRDRQSTLNEGESRQRAHAYALLRTICTTADGDELLSANPCRIRGAGYVKHASETEPATFDQLAVIVTEMPTRLQLMVLAVWCALRYGELVELRRLDLDLTRGVVRIRRAVVWVDGAAIVGDPKSAAGQRDVTIPPHVMPAVTAHLAAMDSSQGTGEGDALLFPATSNRHGTCRPRGCGSSSTGPAAPQADPTCGSTTSATVARCSRPGLAPRSPRSWPASATTSRRRYTSPQAVMDLFPGQGPRACDE